MGKRGGGKKEERDLLHVGVISNALRKSQCEGKKRTLKGKAFLQVVANKPKRGERKKIGLLRSNSISLVCATSNRGKTNNERRKREG